MHINTTVIIENSTQEELILLYEAGKFYTPLTIISMHDWDLLVSNVEKNRKTKITKENPMNNDSHARGEKSYEL
jgi:hypothetical protein